MKTTHAYKLQIGGCLAALLFAVPIHAADPPPGAPQPALPTAKAPTAKKGPALTPGAPLAVTKPTDLIWPMPPDPPRVRWLAEYTDMAKVKNPVAKKPTWAEKISGAKQADEKLELRKPYGITTDSRGRIYAADTELKIVFVIDPVARTVETREGSSRMPLAMPVGVAVDTDNRLFVSDAELHTIICFGPDGQVLSSFGTGVLGRPGGIALDSQRKRLYVADAKNNRIAVFDSKTFELRGNFGSATKKGAHDLGTFLAPTNVAVDKQGLIYVADTWNNRVQILDSTGKTVRAFGAQGDRPGEFIRPKGIAVDSEGHIYVADAEFNNFQIFTPEGKPLLAVGALGDKPGEFALIAGLYIDGQDRIYTTEMYHGRIQVLQYIPQPETADKGVNKAITNGR